MPAKRTLSELECVLETCALDPDAPVSDEDARLMLQLVAEGTSCVRSDRDQPLALVAPASLLEAGSISHDRFHH